MAQRRIGDIGRFGSPDISAAIREDKAAWGIEDEMCLKLRAKGVDFVGVEVRETGDRYVAPLADFFDRAHYVSRSVYRGGMQRFVPFARFRKRAGVVRT